MKTSEKRFWYGVVIIAVVSSTLFISSLFYGYVGDEWFSPSLDEKSVPAAKPH